MLALRRLALAHHVAAALICLAALALRFLVPAGYMISSEQGRIGMTVCSGMVAQPTNTAMSATSPMPDHMPMHGKSPDHGKSQDHGTAPMPCAFATLYAPVLGAADTVLVVAAFAFVATMALRPEQSLKVPLRLKMRPPSRGPPAIA